MNFSCSSSKQSSSSSTSAATNQTHLKTWLNQPSSSSSKIKILNSSSAFSSLPNGLSEMGYTIVENTGTFLKTNAIKGFSDHVRVLAWIQDSDIILTSEVQQYEDSEWGNPEPTGYKSCVKGETTDQSIPDCWRTILIIANHLEGEKQYK